MGGSGSPFVPGRPSNRGLSRFVSFSSRPPTCQTPSLPSPSSSSSSSFVEGGELGDVDGRLRGLRWLRSRLRRHRRLLDGFRSFGFGGLRIADGRGGGDRGLLDDLLRVAAGLDALVGRLADLAVARPTADLGTDHELGSDPSDVLEIATPSTTVILRRRRVERRAVLGQRLQPLEQVLPDRPGEATADLSGRSQLVALVHADGHRAEVARVAAPRRPAADHELLLGPDLDLQPGSSPATRFVAGAPGFAPSLRRRSARRRRRTPSRRRRHATSGPAGGP